MKNNVDIKPIILLRMIFATSEGIDPYNEEYADIIVGTELDERIKKLINTIHRIDVKFEFASWDRNNYVVRYFGEYMDKTFIYELYYDKNFKFKLIHINKPVNNTMKRETMYRDDL